MKQIFLCLFLFAALVGCGNNDSKLTIVTTTLPEATIHSPYSTTLVATGGTLPYTWVVTTGTLPIGLTLNSTSGVISGTPESACSAFVVSVYGASTSSAYYYTIPSILPAGRGVPLHKDQKINVPSGTTITDTSGEVQTVQKGVQEYHTTAESFVFAPTTATGAADHTVVADK